MAKSIRSKAKRKNRTEFRKTIGTEAANANMTIVQAKLQECIQSTQLNSFDRLSNLFAGVNNDDSCAVHIMNDGKKDDDEDEDVDMLMGDTAAVKKSRAASTGKDVSKIPTKKTTRMVGQYGDKTARKMGDKRGRKNGIQTIRGCSIERRAGRSSSKKRGNGKKLAMI